MSELFKTRCSIAASHRVSSEAHKEHVDSKRELARQFCGRTVPPHWRSFLVSAGLVLCFVTGSFAQLDRAALSGTVTDSSGRALPGATVVVQQEATGLRRATATSHNGVYSIPELPVGAYTVVFTHDGFRSVRFENVIQSLGRTRTLNASLQVAGPFERVEVSASTQDRKSVV